MAKPIDLTGQQFGKLKIISRDETRLGGCAYWLCECQCKDKNIISVASYNLRSGHTISCGCIKKIDLSGETFGFLKVIRQAEGQKRGGKKRTKWCCICMRCGNYADVYTECLVSGFTKSCGCLTRDRDMSEEIKKEYVDGTQLSKLQPKISKANKSGVVGVNWDKSRNKWQASIRFKGHKYNLGRFEDFDLACEIRKEAEKQLFGNFLEWYEKNKI